ncbi:homeobox protein cut-like [Caerostris extrusa]|uniref:Homeobox protein cut-like n=1 Tax=Caerostris extrusa TaxID=172846 RepID=A0AAV4R4N4_CAEEX|nr:homeobox protein cut-like [Caerostris extrusa]
MAMMKQQEQKSPTSLLSNGNNGDNRSMDSCDDVRGDRENSKLNHGNSRDASCNSDKSFRRSRKYENDDIPQEMVARIYQGGACQTYRTTCRRRFQNTQRSV